MGIEKERRTRSFGWISESLYDGVETRVIVDYELSLQFVVEVRMHQGSMLSLFLLAVVGDVVTDFAREGALSEFLFADDLVLMSKTVVGLSNKFLNGRRFLRARVGRLTSEEAR